MKTNPGNVSLDNVSTASETAFQRAIFNLSGSYLEGIGHVQWLDLELPVDIYRKGRGHCIDLIGRAEDMSMVICELKFGKPGNGDPNKASEQLYNYLSSVKTNYQVLDDGDSLHHPNALKNGHFYWEEIANESTKLVIGANNDYWEYWNKKGIKPPTNCYCHSINVSSNHFKNQKQQSGQEKYCPSISVSEWSLI